MPDVIRTLVLMRHGKSDYPDGVSDHDRPLAARGLREASLAGEWIRANTPAVDSVLCSTATRTRETLAATGISAPTRFERRMYGSSPDDIIDEARATDPGSQVLLVVGHSPGIPWTALELADSRKSDVAQQISTRFPTSAIAVLTTTGDWTSLAAASATLTAFHIPR